MSSDECYNYFKCFENGMSLTERANNHVCLNLNNPNFSYRYFYNMYTYITKALVVSKWKKKNGLKEVAKWGESICNDKLVDFFSDKKHAKCSCSSVYYK